MKSDRVRLILGLIAYLVIIAVVVLVMGGP